MANAIRFLRIAGANICHLKGNLDVGSRLGSIARLAPLASNSCQCNFTVSAAAQGRKVPLTVRQQFSTSQAIQRVEETENSDTLQNVNETILSEDKGRLFAVIHFSSLQRKVTTDDIVILRKHIEADVGETIRLNKVLLVGAKDFTLLGRPVLGPNQVKVEARVIEKTLEHTKVYYEYQKRRNFRRFKLIKTPLTMIRIINIEVAPVIE